MLADGHWGTAGLVDQLQAVGETTAQASQGRRSSVPDQPRIANTAAAQVMNFMISQFM